jgi:hypothetical protein
MFSFDCRDRPKGEGKVKGKARPAVARMQPDDEAEEGARPPQLSPPAAGPDDCED